MQCLNVVVSYGNIWADNFFVYCITKKIFPLFSHIGSVIPGRLALILIAMRTLRMRFGKNFERWQREKWYV